MSENIQLTIDDRKVSVPKGTTVYQATKQLGIEVPIFCYHDRMPPFGACRVCLVEVEKMGKLQTSCTLEATDGMVVKTQSNMAVEGREGILEFLLINHPLDCPICDRGGECPLQENALHHGPGKSRFFEDKRHFKKPVPVGPVLMLDRERCIVCARCTRFGENIAGDHALVMKSRGYMTEVGTPDESPVKSKFIGNTIMICPVGALTSQVYRFRARPWDNHATASTCSLCPVGCSYFLDSRDGEIMRTRVCENRDVNDIWLCDKGWFGYEHVYHADRLKNPLIRRQGKLEPASWDEALNLVAEKMQQVKTQGKAAAFGGNTLTLEENDLFQQLIRQGLGTNNIDHRIGMPILSLEDEGLPTGMSMSLGECEKLSYAVICGCDVTEEFPVLWLRLKQAMNHGAKIFFLGHFAPEVSSLITQTILHAPGQEIETIKKYLPEMLQKGKSGAIFVGRQYLSMPQRREILDVLSTLQDEHLKLNIMEGSNNSMGARLAGLRPEVGANGKLLDKSGFNSLQVVQMAADEGWDFLYVAGTNPAKKFPKKLWDRARSKLGFMVVQDLFLTSTSLQADVVLPTLCSIEKTGTFINIEGRAQRVQAGKEIPQGIYSDAEIFFRLARMLNISPSDSHYAGEGFQKVFYEKMKSSDKKSLQLSKGLRATFSKILFDEGTRMKHNPHLAEMISRQSVRIHPEEGKKLGLNDGDCVELHAGEYSITAPLSLDKNVAKETIVLPLGCDEIPSQDLGLNYMNGAMVEIKRCS